MSRDYKSKKSRSNSFSGWIGLVVGLAVGLGVAMAVYVKDQRPDAAITKNAKSPRKKFHASETPDADTGDTGAAPEEPTKTYDFYDMLPKFEVVVPEKEKDVRPDTRSVPETRPGTYVLQAGSYKNLSDADRIRAQLGLLGIEAKVQKVSVDNDIWHRIRIGPTSNLDELNRMRQKLRKADIDVLVIRVGD